MGKDEITHLFELLETSLARQSSKWVPSNYDNDGRQNLIRGDQRKEIVVWVQSMSSDKFHFMRDTTFLAVAILDTFLKTVKAHPKYLQCIALTCLYIAAKVNEEDDVIPSTSELLRLSRCGCSVKEVCRMEFCILDLLAWDPNLPTSVSFLQLFFRMLLSKCKDIFPGRMHIKYMHYMSKLLECCLLEPCFLAYEPSILALSVFSLQLRLVWSYWNTVSAYLSTILRVDEQVLSECCSLIREKFSDMLLASIRLPNRKAMSRQAVKRPVGPLKRKVVDDDSEEDYDLYEGIKRLYGEDSNSAFETNNSSTSTTANNATSSSSNANGSTCSSEVAKFSGRLLGLTHGQAL